MHGWTRVQARVGGACDPSSRCRPAPPSDEHAPRRAFLSVCCDGERIAGITLVSRAKHERAEPTRKDGSDAREHPTPLPGRAGEDVKAGRKLTPFRRLKIDPLVGGDAGPTRRLVGRLTLLGSALW